MIGRRWKIIPLLLLLLFTFACEEDDFTFEPAEDEVVVDDDAPITGTSLNAQYQLLLDQVNDLRATGCRCGNQQMPPVGPVSWNDQLAQASQVHSSDMDRNAHFSHTGTDGSNPGERISRAGYSWRTYGENIAVGYETATAVFNGWKNSPGHCRNLMNAAFLEMGAARVGRYYTQDFGAKR